MLFLAVVVGICLFSIQDLLIPPLDYVKCGMVIIGLLGVILYATGVRAYSLFLWSWIILQVFQAEKLVDGEVIPIVDLHLSISYSYDINTTFQGIDYVLGINLLPLVFIPFMFTLPRTNLLGEEFMLSPFRDNSWLEEKMPQVVKVLDVMDFSGNKKWVLVHLSKGITYEGTKYVHALLKAKDFVSIKKRSEKQIVHFRLFDGHNQPGKGLQEFPFIDWAVLE